jgi:hypothetical protein
MSQKEQNMRQERWFELIKDYDCVIDYYQGRADVVVNALSCRNKMLEKGLITWNSNEVVELQ